MLPLYVERVSFTSIEIQQKTRYNEGNVNLWMNMVNQINWFGTYWKLLCLPVLPSRSFWGKRRAQPSTSVKHQRASLWMTVHDKWLSAMFFSTVNMTNDVVICIELEFRTLTLIMIMAGNESDEAFWSGRIRNFSTRLRNDIVICELGWNFFCLFYPAGDWRQSPARHWK